MQKSKFVLALGAAAALAVTPLAASSASAGNTNSGSDATYGSAAKVSGDIAACKAITQPKGKYVSKTKLVDLSGLSDFTPVSSQNGVSFSPTMEKRSVPGSWATWGSPPDTESATPNILYTVGATSVDITFPKKGAKKGMAGAEVEPNPFEVHTFTGVWKNKAGDPICTLSVDADGSAGAKLLAAKKAKKAKTLTISSDVDFSFAQVRWK